MGRRSSQGRDDWDGNQNVSVVLQLISMCVWGGRACVRVWQGILLVSTYPVEGCNLFTKAEKINIENLEEQAYINSPQCITATQEIIFIRVNWENKGIQINGKLLKRFESVRASQTSEQLSK